LLSLTVILCLLQERLSRCAEMQDALARETPKNIADVSDENRPKLEELLIEGMVVGANVEEMNTLTRLLLAHDLRRLVRPCCIVSFVVVPMDVMTDTVYQGNYIRSGRSSRNC